MRSFFSRSTRVLPTWVLWSHLLSIVLISLAASSQSFSHTTIQVRSQLLSTGAPFSFPETLVVGPNGDLYLLDTDLSTLFTVNTETGSVERICGAEKLSSPSDLAVDRQGNLWVLSALRSRIFKLTSGCDVQTEIVSKWLPLSIATNSFGEVIILNGAGTNLFDIYRSDGKYLRGFGKKLDYKDQTTNSELSNGRIAPDRSGGFFFSFNYPPLIRHYGRQGNLISEFKPESDVVIAPPNVSVKKRGNAITVISSYQILVLDMTVDSQGRLYLLLSGKYKTPALNEGTRKLAVLGGTGRLLRMANLDYNFHRLAAGNRGLYLLRNRKPLRLDIYAL
jgi:hypothetical protein